MFFLNVFKFYCKKVSKMLKKYGFCYLQVLYNVIKGGMKYEF